MVCLVVSARNSWGLAAGVLPAIYAALGEKTRGYALTGR